MKVRDVFEIVRFASNQSVNGDISVSEFNRVAILAENATLNYFLGVPEQYQYQRPIPRIQYSFNQNIRQKISHLISEPTELTVDANGHVNYPEDYIQTDAMYTETMEAIVFAPQDKLASHLKSTLDPIATNPVFLLEEGQFQFYPKSIGKAKISYVRKPVPMKYATTKDANGRDVYNEADSVDPSWDDTNIYEVIVRILALVGVNLQLPILYQYAEQVKKEGT